MKPEILIEINKSTANMLESMFGRDAVATDFQKGVFKPPFRNRYMIVIGISNDIFQGQIVWGFDDALAEKILEGFLDEETEEAREEMKISAMEEMANTASNEAIATEPVISDYQFMDTTPPMTYSGESIHFMRSDGRCGIIKVMGHDLNTYIAINEFGKSFFLKKRH